MNNDITRCLGVFLLFCFLQMPMIGQNADPILFSVGDQEVKTSEFLYIYNKNNGGDANFNKSSVEEYLELYKNFKLKVYHARQLKMDTISRLNKELHGYREQLAATYLNDNGVMGRLANEAYDRMQKEAEVSHILISVPKNMAAADSMKSYNQAMEVYNLLMNENMAFEDVAKVQSHDAKNKKNGGYIGFVKAILPRGYYDLESTIYNLKPGEISKPVRSPRGYHIVKLHKFRDAKPEVEIAQILIKKNPKDKDPGLAKRKIDDIHNRITRGVPFEELASKESQDETTNRKGGRIGYIKTGVYDEVFETAAYSLTEDGQMSEPIETRVGYHILKRLGVKEVQSYADSKRRIESELRRTERERMARQAMIERIKLEENFKVDVENKEELFGLINGDIFKYRWEQPNNVDNAVLFSFSNNIDYKVNDFLAYLTANSKERVRLNRESKDQALQTMFNSFVNDMCLELEKSQLEKKHPDFAALMREYEEGILLFEITKENVWDRASSDTTGLKEYFNTHRQDYQHPERIEITTYTLTDTDAKKAKKITKQIKKKTDEQLAIAYPKIPQDKRVIEKTDEDSGQYIWKADKISPLVPLGDSGMAFKITKTKKVIPSSPKALSECRGYVIAHYQEALEKSWLAELRTLYPIKENQDAIKKLIKTK